MAFVKSSDHFSKQRTVKKARKDRKCQYCQKQLKKGGPAESVVIKDYEGFHYFHVCVGECKNG